MGGTQCFRKGQSGSAGLALVWKESRWYKFCLQYFKDSDKMCTHVDSVLPSSTARTPRRPWPPRTTVVPLATYYYPCANSRPSTRTKGRWDEANEYRVGCARLRHLLLPGSSFYLMDCLKRATLLYVGVRRNSMLESIAIKLNLTLKMKTVLAIVVVSCFLAVASAQSCAERAIQLSFCISRVATAATDATSFCQECGNTLISYYQACTNGVGVSTVKAGKQKKKVRTYVIRYKLVVWCTFKIYPQDRYKCKMCLKTILIILFRQSSILFLKMGVVCMFMSSIRPLFVVN